jgi:hypothetical protein
MLLKGGWPTCLQPVEPTRVNGGWPTCLQPVGNVNTQLTPEESSEHGITWEGGTSWHTIHYSHSRRLDVRTYIAVV